MNWGEVENNKAKIAEYRERMLGQKQELGHMGREKASSVKARAYLPYGRQVDDGYMGQTADARDNKAKD